MSRSVENGNVPCLYSQMLFLDVKRDCPSIDTKYRALSCSSELFEAMYKGQEHLVNSFPTYNTSERDELVNS